MIDRKRIITELIKTYAVMGKKGTGYAARCRPRENEKSNPLLRGSNDKIIFASRAHAAAFAQHIIDPDHPGLVPYPCPRGGHWHVMNKAKKARREARYGSLPSE